MKIQLYTSEIVFADLAHEWDSLLNNSAADQIFLTLTWITTWWEAYCPGQIWTLVIRDLQGQCVGIAPWFISVLADGTRLVSPIGGADVTDYLEVIVRRGSETVVFEHIASWLDEHSADFDRICLCNIPEASPMMNGFVEAVKSRQFLINIDVENVCPIVTLPDTFSDYVSGLDKKNRHELRRKMRKIAPLADWYIVGPEHDLQVELANFLNLMAASNPEKAAFMENVQNRRFFEQMVPLIAQNNWLQLAFLTVSDQPAATYLSFDYGNRILVYNSGHDPAVFRNLSPGIVLIANLIEYAISCNKDVFDFLRGNEIYKYNLGGKNTSVYRLEITKGT